MRIDPPLGVSILASRLGRAADVRRVRRSQATRRPTDEDAHGRDLPVPVETAAPDEGPARFVRLRPDAAFLAQLIAAAEDLPQTRRLRRVEARIGVATYARIDRGEGLLAPGYLVDLAR